MVCVWTCGIAMALIGAMMWLMLTVDKEVLLNFHGTFNEMQREKMIEIRNMRCKLWLQGLGLGVVLALAYAWYTTGYEVSLLNACTFSAIAMGVNFFYYTLMPKEEYMIQYLGPHQIDEWLEVKKMFQGKYWMGMLIGLFACFVLGTGVQTTVMETLSAFGANLSDTFEDILPF